MIEAIQNLISSPAIYNLTQSTVTQVTTETCLKAIGRPSFILMDKKIDPQTKRFSATKEFLYQMICLAIYLSLVIPIFKKGAFAIGRKLYKDEAVFKAFKKPEDFLNYHKLDEKAKLAKLEEISKTVTSGDKFTKENITEDSENLAKGVIEASSIVGSVTGLALAAPIVSHPLIHPIMNFLGFGKHEQNTDNQKPNA